MPEPKRTFKGGPRSLIKKENVKKSDFGIKNQRMAVHVIYGRLCFFLTLDSNNGNELQKDGFVYWVRTKAELVPEGVKQTTLASVFAREKPRGPYTYYGDANTIVRYDKNRNKLIWG